MRIGFVGVGNMGGPMAANLLRAGHQLTVTDLRKEAAAELVGAGAQWADTGEGAATGADVTFMSLPKPADVEAAMLGPAGVLAGSAKGSTIVDLSTNSPAVVRALAEKAAAQGVGFLDAPVSGGVRGARNATLAVMVGGEEALFTEHRPLFEAIGANIFHVGAVGNGNVAKLVNNMLAFIGMMGASEALLLGAKAGIDPNILRDIVMAGSGQSFAWDSASRAVLKDRLAPTFTTTLASKDIGLATDLAAELGVPVPMGAAAEALLVGYRDNGYAAEDVMATIKSLEEQVGFQVRGLWQDR